MTKKVFYLKLRLAIIGLVFFSVKTYASEAMVPEGNGVTVSTAYVVVPKNRSNDLVKMLSESSDESAMNLLKKIEKKDIAIRKTVTKVDLLKKFSKNCALGFGVMSSVIIIGSIVIYLFLYRNYESLPICNVNCFEDHVGKFIYRDTWGKYDELYKIMYNMSSFDSLKCSKVNFL